MDRLIYSILAVKIPQEKLMVFLSGLKGLLGADLCSVSFNDVSAITSNIKRSDLISDIGTAIEYAAVIETLSQQFTVLPMRFGSIMESDTVISSMLEKNYTEISANLLKVENKYEFGLKILCDSAKLRGWLLAKAADGTKALSSPAPGISKSIYRDWVDKKLEEHRLEELLLNHIDSVIAEIKGHLSSLDAVAKFKKMLSETTIIDAVILLRNDQKDSVVRITEKLQKQYPGLSFVLTGPWAPYSFVDITIK